MTDTALAIIKWLPVDAGGRRAPAGPNYRCVARFDADPNYSRGHWSFAVMNAWDLDDPGVSLATVGFLADGAPADLLGEDSHFDLMEGPRVVATGIVVAVRNRTSVKSMVELLRHVSDRLRPLGTPPQA